MELERIVDRFHLRGRKVIIAFALALLVLFPLASTQDDFEDASLEQIAEHEASIFVNQVYDLENSRAIADQTFLPGFEPTDVIEIDYFIMVKNTGDIKMHEVWLNDTLLEKIVFVSAGLYDADTLKITNSLTAEELVENEDGTTKIVRLKLGDLDTGGEKHIKLTVRHKADEIMEDKYKGNIVEASGLSLGNSKKEDISIEAKEAVEK